MSFRSNVLAALSAAVMLSTVAAPAIAQPPPPLDVGQLVYLATQKMVDTMPHYVSRGRPIIVTTMVSVDDLEHSSTFGRLSSELILNKLAQNRYTVKDVTYMHVLDIDKSTGEMVLTRDATRLSRDMNAQAVVVGTYAKGGRQIYLNIRMLNAESGTVISSADVAIPYDEDTAPLIDMANAASPRGRSAY
jgi:TolB-like protein